MELAYKPDLEDAKKYWRAYWAGEIIDRPAICIRAFKDEKKPLRWPRILTSPDDAREVLAEYEESASQILWMAEAIPFLNPNFGPDMFAAWLGGDLHINPADQSTSWSTPVIDDWDAQAEGISHPHGVWWDRMLDFMGAAAEYSGGKFLVGVPDLHSNMDALSALRGPQNLCMDLLDVPEKIDAAMTSVRRAYRPVFEGLERAGGFDRRGYIGWMPFYSETRFAVLQCDFACMVSPEHFRRWILPALEEEAAYLDHSVYHYDGPDALVHLHDVLSIKKIHAIQWVPGAGNPPPIEWMDLLVEIQKAGKGLYLGCSPQEMRVFCQTLRPEGVLYDIYGVHSQSEAEELLAWAKANT